MPSPEQLYIYRWGNNAVRRKMQSRVCRLISRGALSTWVVEFVDTGEIYSVSANLLKKFKQGKAGK